MVTVDDQAKFHLFILGSRQFYHVTAKRYSDKKIKNEFLKPEETITVLFNWNNNGYTTWLVLTIKTKIK